MDHVPAAGPANRIRVNKQPRFHICDIPIKLEYQFDLLDQKGRCGVIFAADDLRLIRHQMVLFPLGCAALPVIV